MYAEKDISTAVLESLRIIAVPCGTCADILLKALHYLTRQLRGRRYYSVALEEVYFNLK